jgi:hypothetical protein
MPAATVEVAHATAEECRLIDNPHYRDRDLSRMVSLIRVPFALALSRTYTAQIAL